MTPTEPGGIQYGLILVIGIGLALLLSLCFWFHKIFKKRANKKRKEKFFKRNGGIRLQQQQQQTNEGTLWTTKHFQAKELKKATDNFNESRILGEGGQGTVYKGMLSNGQIVAIKKSKEVDENQVEQFINEVVILSQISHRNVVKLLGCCLEAEVPLLVYEFVPNGTLFDLIHDPNMEFPVSWNMRLKIAADIAGALTYLHSACSLPIYHRDIKSSNILLDEKYVVKVSDFGTSKSVTVDQTHVTTLVKGTFGYLDPEYFQSSQFTEKSDVYSFGVVLVELLTGQRAISTNRVEEERSLAMRFLISMERDCLDEILDDQVSGQERKKEVTVVARLAQRCLNLQGRMRPTMKEVAMELESVKRSQMPAASSATRELISNITSNSQQFRNVRREALEQAHAKFFTAKELKKATDNFNESSILRQGGQGAVYKGMLSNSQIVVIKKAKKISEDQLEQFINEVVILSQINHSNVLKLLGFCLETEVPLLVYEFTRNGTLFDLIHDPNREFPVSWNMRLKFAADTAGALAYLHSATSLPIYHRDIKTSNILLDDKYVVKVSGFGISKSVTVDQTHVTTLVKGTFGCLDPEYLWSGRYTEKSDVYSFAVVVVELLTGQRVVSSNEDVGLAARFLEAMEIGRLDKILDDQVLGEGRKEEVVAVAKLAQRCLNLQGRMRPTMKEVVTELESIRMSLTPAASSAEDQGVHKEDRFDGEKILMISDFEYSWMTSGIKAASSSSSSSDSRPLKFETM